MPSVAFCGLLLRQVAPHPDDLAAARPGAFQMHLDNDVELLLRHLVQHPVAKDPGVVHEHVESAEGIESRLDQRLGSSDRSDRLGVGGALAPQLLDLLDDGRRRFFIDVVHEDARTLAGEGQRNRSADTSPRAGDHTRLARHPIRHARILRINGDASPPGIDRG
jgi:hypothetical protein